MPSPTVQRSMSMVLLQEFCQRMNTDTNLLTFRNIYPAKELKP